jgi:hypothetical protein
MYELNGIGLEDKDREAFRQRHDDCRYPKGSISRFGVGALYWDIEWFTHQKATTPSNETFIRFIIAS